MLEPLNPHQKSRTWVVDTLFLCACIGILFWVFAGSRALLAPDEGRYAEIAREMISSSDYLTPHLNGIKYFEKPVLFYWLEAAFIKLFGGSTWSLRSVNLSLGLLGCLFTYYATRCLYNRRTGWMAAGILATSMLYFAMSHMLSLDLPVTVFLSACLYSFILAVQYPAWRRPLMWLAACASALAVLTKGLIGLIFPGLIVLTWFSIMGEWRQLKTYALFSSLAIFLAITLPWHYLVNIKNPEFFNYYFIAQHFLRYTTKEIGHYQPVWFFIPTLFLGFFPWIVFLPQAILSSIPLKWEQRKSYQKEIFFLLWVGIIFTFFSFSQSKLMPYILPIIPPLAIITAHYLQRKPSKISYLLLILISLGFAILLYNFTHHALLANPSKATFILLTAATTLVAGSVLSYILASYYPKYAVHSTMGMMALFLVIALSAIPSVDTRTVLPLANMIKSQLKPQDTVVTYNIYFQELPYYLERRVSILNWENELKFGMQFQDTRDWMLNDANFMKKWHGDKRVFVFMKNEELDNFARYHPPQEIHLLGKTPTTVLLSNRAFKPA